MSSRSVILEIVLRIGQNRMF